MPQFPPAGATSCPVESRTGTLAGRPSPRPACHFSYPADEVPSHYSLSARNDALVPANELERLAAAQGAAQRAVSETLHPGMPALGPGAIYPRFKRRMNDPVFYLVPSLMWLKLALRHRSLTLPTVANPAMEAGGLWGESKVQGLELFGPGASRFVAPYVAFQGGGRRTAEALRVALARLRDAEIAFPIVGKPDRGYQGWGVRLLQDAEELGEYLDRAPAEATILLQAFVPYGGEAGIFYVREPGKRRGRIVSMALTYAPHVVGDGRSTIEELVLRDSVLRKNRPIYHQRNAQAWSTVLPAGTAHVLTNARSARLGAVYRDCTGEVTQALENAIDRIAQEIDGFHFGRFDIRFKSLRDLQVGRNFAIVELNGAGAEMLHLWDGRTSLIRAYRILWVQYRTLFAIGSEMRRRGHRPTGLRQMVRLQRGQERLRRLYPTSS